MPSYILPLAGRICLLGKPPDTCYIVAIIGSQPQHYNRSTTGFMVTGPGMSLRPPRKTYDLAAAPIGWRESCDRHIEVIENDGGFHPGTRHACPVRGYPSGENWEREGGPWRRLIREPRAQRTLR